MQSDRFRMVFVFNHKYDKNLDKLDAIYRERFPDIRYLVPFYRGTRPDVIGVNESSAQFQGYFAHAAHAYIDPAVSHYVFIADDLLLNPEMNAGNLLDIFKVPAGAGCIENLNPLDRNPFAWPHMLGALLLWKYERFVMYRQELPTFDEATARLERHGLKCNDVTWRNLRTDKGWRRFEGWRFAVKTMIRHKGRFALPYPMLGAYSDLVIVPRESIHEFVHLCGVFAAMRLWVEIAIPTALALSCERISQVVHIGRPTRLMWKPDEVEELERKADRQVSRAFDVAGRENLYIHPIKLSRWKV